MLNKFGISSREIGDEGNHTRIELGEFEGEESNLFIFALEAPAVEGRWYRERWNPTAFFALALALALRGVNVVEVRKDHVALDPDRVYEIDLGTGNRYLDFDRRPAGIDDASAWRRTTFKPSAIEVMRALIAAGNSGIAPSKLTPHVKCLLAESGVSLVAVDPRWPNGNTRLDPALEWRPAPPFSTIPAYEPPAPSRERQIIVRIGLRVDGTPLTRGFTGVAADAVATMIANHDGVHFSQLDSSASYYFVTLGVPFEGDEATGVVKLVPPTPWKIVSDTKPKWGAA